ncbi:MAG: FtsW/RodA/SpoVE family cell cycle protein, partial [Lachnospiraceae bacterium]|nr:FtsW/RodA/SpoVE family cell cycle protein [Lachnospiraceae bacterium]
MIVAQRRYQNNHRGRVKKQEESFFDYTLLFIVLFLLAFGLVMLYSSSSYEGSTLKNPDPAYFLKKQAASTVVGMAAMIVVANIPYHFWERFATMGYIVSIV